MGLRGVMDRVRVSGLRVQGLGVFVKSTLFRMYGGSVDKLPYCRSLNSQ